MRIKGQTYRVDWLHLAFLTAIAAYALWYLLDARSVSLAVNNLLLVQPLAIAALVLYFCILPQCFVREGAEAEALVAPTAAAEPDDPLQPKLPEGRALARVGLLGASLGLMVFSMPTVGFDIAIFFFALATMLICGERRPIPLALYPIAVTLFAVYGFRALIPYPIPTTLL